MNFKIVAALSALTLAAGSASAAPNLLIDGDFEAFQITGTGPRYQTYGAGSLGAWTIGGMSIDTIQDGYGAISGVSVDMAGTPGPASLSQSFNALAGYTYQLKFDVGNNGGSQLDVSFGGTTTSYTPGNPATTYTLSWTAATASSQLVKFSTPDSGNNGPVLDNVVLTVTAVPEPGTYALLLSGLAAVGFVARRRQA